MTCAAHIGRWRIVGLAFAASLAAQTPPSVSLQGCVVDALGDPVPAASVWLTGAGTDAELARGCTDGQGRFVLPRVSALVPFEVHATAAGKTSAKIAADPQQWANGGVVQLADAATVTGTVTDAAGQPVADAIVVGAAADQEAMPIEPVEARTDAAGHYRLEHVAVGAVIMRAWSSRLPPVQRSEQIGDDSQVDFAFTAAPMATLTLPAPEVPADVLADLQVIVRGEPLLPHCMQRGRFTDGTWRVRGLPQDHAAMATVVDPQRRWWFQPQSLIDNTVLAERLAPRRWCIRLVDGDGTPLSGETLLLALEGNRRLLCTAADGTARAEMPSADGEMAVVTLVGSRRVIPEAIRLSARDEPTVLRAGPGATLRGRLVDAAGVAVAGAPFVLEAWSPWQPALSIGCTDDNGGILITGLAANPGPLRLRLLIERRCVRVPALSLGVTVDLGAVTAPIASAIEGVVRDSAGVPVGGALVSWQSTMTNLRAAVRNGIGQELRCVRADRLGCFRVAPVEAGIWQPTMRVERIGRVPLGGGVEVEAGATTSHDLMLPRR